MTGAEEGSGTGYTTPIRVAGAGQQLPREPVQAERADRAGAPVRPSHQLVGRVAGRRGLRDAHERRHQNARPLRRPRQAQVGEGAPRARGDQTHPHRERR